MPEPEVIEAGDDQPAVELEGPDEELQDHVDDELPEEVV